MRAALLAILLASTRFAAAEPTAVRCDDASTAELTVDGMLDDWPAQLQVKGGPGDAGVDVRCAWDGKAFAIAVDVRDNRIVRVRSGRADEDRVEITVAPAGGRAVKILAHPASAVAKARVVKPRKVSVADSLQPKGFSVEARVPGNALPGLTASTPALDVRVRFFDSDRATGGDTTTIDIPLVVELGDRKDLLDDFLRSVKLRRGDVQLDTLVDVDPDRRGKERIVAGGRVIGVLTEQFAYVELPVARATDVKRVALLPIGPRGTALVTAIVRQSGNGGSRDLLMLWTVWSGQLHPLGQIEVRKEQGGKVLESSFALAKGPRGATELVVTPRPAVGWTADTWNEAAASDAEPILLPWDETKRGVAFSISGPAKELVRRELPIARRR